jgi:hypothetical protein
MKKAILIFLLAINITPAHANEVGGWVKVNASGAIISGTSVCTPDVCGDVNSSFSKLTLLPGERWVQITKADTTGNVAGPNVVAQTAPNQTVSAKVDPVTNVATVTTKTVEPLAPRVTVVKETETTYAVEQPVPVTTVKAPVIEIKEPETIKEDPAFVDWLALIHDFFQKLFTNFTWAWDL